MGIRLLQLDQAVDPMVGDGPFNLLKQDVPQLPRLFHHLNFPLNVQNLVKCNLLETKVPHLFVLHDLNLLELGFLKDLEVLDRAHVGVMLCVVDEIDEFLETIAMVLHQDQVRIPELLLFHRFFFQIQTDALVFFVFLALDAFDDSANVLHDVNNMPNNFIAVGIEDIKFTIIYNQKALDKLLLLQKVNLLRIQLHTLRVDMHIQRLLIVAEIFTLFKYINGLHLSHV